MVETNITSELALRVDARVIVNIVARRDEIGDTAVSHLRNVQQLLVLIEHESEDGPGYQMNNATFGALKSRVASALALLEPQIEMPMTARERNIEALASGPFAGATDLVGDALRTESRR